MHILRVAFVLVGLLVAADAQQWAARHGMSSAGYQTAFSYFVDKGYRLADVSAFTIKKKQRYAAIWIKKGGPAWQARHGMSAANYQYTFNLLVKKAYVPSFLDGAKSDASNGKFAAMWEKGFSGAWVARHGLTSSDYQAEFNKWTGKGYRLTDVAGYEVKGKERYAAIWKKVGGSAWYACHGLTGTQYQKAFNYYTSKGYKPIHVDGYSVGGKAYFAAIWAEEKGAYVARHGMSSGQYQAKFNYWVARGYRLVDVSGYTDGEKERYAAIWHK